MTAEQANHFLNRLHEKFSTEEIILDYIEQYLKDKNEDFVNIIDFISKIVIPELNTDEDDFVSEFVQDAAEIQDKADYVRELCDEFLVTRGNVPARSLTRKLEFDKPVILEQLGGISLGAEYSIPKRSTDISLSSARFITKSVVDKKKLQKQEQKLQKKLISRKLEATNEKSSISYVEPDGKDYTATNIDPFLKNGFTTRDIILANFDITFGGKRILSNADLTITFGRKYGLIGRNGIGKSTLLRAISRREIVSAGGKTGIPDWLRILHVEQEIHGDETPVLESVLLADSFRVSLLKREQDLNNKLKLLEEGPHTLEDVSSERESLSLELKEIYQKQQFIESDKAEARAAIILAGLGFNSEQQKLPTKSFSGGWRMRIALARALFCKPDVLLCDEPTNHLDINAVIWLEQYLQSWNNTLVLVSHDRDFLDNVCTDIIHMHSERLDCYKGNYSIFLGTRLERRKNQLKEYEAQLQYRQHLQAFIDRWRYDSKRASQAQSKIKILEKLPPLQPLEDDGVDDGELHFKWPDPVDKLANPILQADEITFSYEYINDKGYKIIKPILNQVSFSVQLNSRIAIVGPNGAGKSTLLKLLIGELNPNKGIIQRNPRLRIAFFSQHHVDAFGGSGSSALEANSVAFLASKHPGYSIEDYRKILGRFGITGSIALQPLKTLSGGQKSRVVFALMAINNPHILVLDEVSNHLDIMTIDSLTKALNQHQGFQGGVVVVSHDARFIDKVCNELWVCNEGKITKFVHASNETVLGTENTGNVEGKSGIMEYKRRILRELNK